MIRKGTDVTQFDEQQTFTYDDIHIFYPLTDELTMVQAKFTRKVSGRVGVKTTVVGQPVQDNCSYTKGSKDMGRVVDGSWVSSIVSWQRRCPLG